MAALPSQSDRRYDRQLRLWAASGQRALEDAHVLLINAGSGAAGAEALKNLVLPGRLDRWKAYELTPGIGRFTIVDPAVVAEADVGVNFFVQADDVGRPRAEATAALLQQLNPAVHGVAVQKVRRSCAAEDRC